jgi:hypothetical protein
MKSKFQQKLDAQAIIQREQTLDQLKSAKRLVKELEDAAYSMGAKRKRDITIYQAVLVIIFLLSIAGVVVFTIMAIWLPEPQYFFALKMLGTSFITLLVSYFLIFISKYS